MSYVWSCVLLSFVGNNLISAEDYNLVNPDGSFDFGYETPDSFHNSQASRNNVQRGEFGGRSPETGAVDTVQYTAGPRGFRPRGKNIARKYDFSQAGPRPVGSLNDPYFDPSEDPSYNFGFNTGVYNRQEAANRLGDVAGKYSYLDDIGERHNVEFIAGENTGFHVKTPFPDSNPRAIGPLYFNGRGNPIPRGRSSIQRGLDGSYRFVSAGPDQRRSETSDSTGHVRGSYTYIDDVGVQHSVHYIAGPETGYRVLKNVKGPHLPTVFPFSRPDIIPPEFYDYLAPGSEDLFDTAATGNLNPTKGGSKPPQQGSDRNDQDNKNSGSSFSNFGDPTEKTTSDGFDGFGSHAPGGTTTFIKPTSSTGFGTRTRKPFGNRRPVPSYEDDGSDVFTDDIFGPVQTKPAVTTSKPVRTLKPSYPDDGSYQPTGDDGSYNPNKKLSGGGSTSTSFGDKNTGTSIYNADGNFSDKTEIGTGIKYNGNGIGIHIPGSNSGTIVRNLGDRLFSIPPGATVRAHVQAIDLLDLEGRSISPSEQLNAETSKEQNVETSNIKEEYTTPSTTTSTAQTTTAKNTTSLEPLAL